MGAVVAGVVMVAGAAMGQTTGLTPGEPSRGIVPVTGPSTVPGLSEAARVEVISAGAPGDVVTPEGAPKGAAGRPRVATSTRQAPRTMKAVQRTTAKTTVRKATVAKQVGKGPMPAKTRHVAVAKHQPPAHHATVSKPVPLTKHGAPARGAAPTQPVLPRV
jgi:hypothetical protein